MIAPLLFFAMPHTKRYKKYQLGRSSIYDLYSKIFAQQPGETSHDYTLCFSTAAAAAPPSASHPRRPRRDGAALRGSEQGHAAVVEQLISAGATVDAANKATAVAPEGFSGRFGSGSDEVTEGVRTLAGDFRSLLWDVEWYLLFKDPLFVMGWAS